MPGTASTGGGEEPELRLERGEGRQAPAVLRLARPHVGNAVSRQGGRQLARTVDALASDPPCGLVVAATGDRFFCTGGDLADYTALTTRESARQVSLTMQDVLRRLRELPFLVVAAVEGAAIGGGTELALACDLRVAGAQATFALPQSRLGVVTGWGGGGWLREAVGRGRAVELLTSGRTVDADEAHDLGLVDHLVPPGNAEAEALRLVAAARDAAPDAVRAVKQVLEPTATPESLAEVFADLWVSEHHRAAEAAWRSRRDRAAQPSARSSRPSTSR